MAHTPLKEVVYSFPEDTILNHLICFSLPLIFDLFILNQRKMWLWIKIDQEGNLLLIFILWAYKPKKLIKI
jgi:hypothetical protein